MKRGLLFALALLTLAGGAHAQTTDGLTGPRPAETVEAGKLSKLPKQIKFVEAEYPPAATEKELEAEVVLLLDIDEKGAVTGVVVTEPSAHPGLGFEDAAVTAAQQFEFEPAEMDGKPIAIQLSYRTRFKLKAKAPPPAPAAAAPARTPVENFTGQLRERGTRLPIAGVVLTIFRDVDGKPQGFEATTDGDGRFRFYDLAPGDWKILVEPPGFYPFRTTETVKENEKVDATYYVERGSYNPYDVTVTATRPRKEVSRTIISAKVADKIPGTLGDPLAVIQNFAGVARTPSTALLVVRGSAPEDSRVFVDGVEVPLAYHFFGLKSVLPVGMLENIEFYPGNFSPMYGRATGGVVDIQIKKLQPQKLGGYVDVSLLDSGIYAEVPINDKAAIAVAGRRSYIDVLIRGAVPEDAGVNLIAAPRYYDYQLLGNYRPTAAHDLRAFFFASDDEFRILFQNPAEVDTSATIGGFSNETNFYRSILQHRYVPSERFSNELRLAQGRDRIKFVAGPLELNLDLYQVQIRDTVRFKLLDSLALNAGLDVLFADFDALVRLPLPPQEGQPMTDPDLSMLLESRNKDVREWYPAAYAELEWQPLPGLLVLPGVRVDRFPRAKQTVAQPRLTARLDLGEKLVLKGGAGYFAQQANIQNGEDDAVFGNPNLESERAKHYSLGVEYRPRPHINLDLTGFYKDLDQLVSETQALKIVDGKEMRLRYDNGGSGRVYGLELVARHEFTEKFTGWIAYTYSRSERQDSGKTGFRLFDFDQTHILSAVGSYLLPRNWQIGGRFRLVSGNPRTPVVRGVFNSVDDEYTAVFGAVNSQRNKAFHQLDLRIDKRWIYPRWMFSVYLDIQNVYNRANTEQTQYNFNFREAKDGAQSLPLIPILGLRAEL